MNKIKGTILLLLTATLYMVAALNGAVGCMDNNQYLRQSFDTKAYHYVQCDCVCRSHAPGSNRCGRCGHLMVPQTEEYVSAVAEGYGATAKAGHEVANLMQNPDVKLKQMLKAYTASKTARPNRD